MTDELKETNRRLDEIRSVSIEDIEQKLTKQVKTVQTSFDFVFFLLLVRGKIPKDN